MYYTNTTQSEKAARIFHVLGLASMEGGQIFSVLTEGRRNPRMSYESIMIMLTFGIFLVCLIRLIIEIIKNMKK